MLIIIEPVSMFGIYILLKYAIRILSIYMHISKYCATVRMLSIFCKIPGVQAGTPANPQEKLTNLIHAWHVCMLSPNFKVLRTYATATRHIPS
jgi:hypothetical protein